LCKRGNHLILYLFNELIFVFDGKKSRFFDDLGLLDMRWGRREWPIMGPVEIKISAGALRCTHGNYALYLKVGCGG
jgi:hypothetical protein